MSEQGAAAPQVDSVSKRNRAIEHQSRFRAVPINELVDRMIVCSLTAFSMSGCSVQQTLFVRDQVRREIAWVVSSFSGVWAFWAAFYAAFRQNRPQTPYFAVTGDLWRSRSSNYAIAHQLVKYCIRASEA